jgi:hypothetical protein
MSWSSATLTVFQFPRVGYELGDGDARPSVFASLALWPIFCNFAYAWAEQRAEG